MNYDLERIVDYAIKLKYEDLPKEIIEKAKILLLDSIGCCLGGSASKLGLTVINAVKELGGSGNSTIIGDGKKVNCVLAGQINAITLDALDYNDTVSGLGHPGATVIPAAIALAEEKNIDGKELITSIIAGYEASIRIGFALRPSTERGKPGSFQYWHAFGAATVASRILGLEKEKTLSAYGYAGASAPLAKRSKKMRPLPFTKDNFGEITAAGILGAYYALHDFKSPHEPDFDYWVNDLDHLSALTKNLREKYQINLVSLKPWSACRFMHSSLDVLDEIIKENKIKPEDIENVNVSTISPLAIDLLLPPNTESRNGYKPGNMVDGEFDFRYCLSMVILGKEPGLPWYEKKMLESEEALDIASRINVKRSFQADVLLNKYPYEDRRSLTELEIITKKGSKFRKKAEFIRGSPEKPLSKNEVINKFKALTKQINMDEKKIKEIISLIEKIDSLPNISQVMDLVY
jgi:2-methylcitrate dehydratase PrpD